MGNWLQRVTHAHVLAPSQLLDMLRWVERLP